MGKRFVPIRGLRAERLAIHTCQRPSIAPPHRAPDADLESDGRERHGRHGRPVRGGRRPQHPLRMGKRFGIRAGHPVEKDHRHPIGPGGGNRPAGQHIPRGRVVQLPGGGLVRQRGQRRQEGDRQPLLRRETVGHTRRRDGERHTHKPVDQRAGRFRHCGDNGLHGERGRNQPGENRVARRLPPDPTRQPPHHPQRAGGAAVQPERIQTGAPDPRLL